MPKRFRTHLCHLRQGVHDNKHLQAAFAMYGLEAFKLVVLTICSRAELNAQEQAWIDFYVSWDKQYGYNKERYVTGLGPLSEETKRRISDAHQTNGKLRGRTLASEHRKNISKALRAEEISAAQAQRSRERVWTQDSKDKIRKAKLGRKASDQDRLAMSKAHKGVPFSAERKAKVGDTVKGVWANMSPEQRQQRHKKMWETRRRNAAGSSDDQD